MDRKRLYIIGGVVSVIVLGIIIGLAVHFSTSPSSGENNNNTDNPNDSSTEQTTSSYTETTPTEGSTHTTTDTTTSTSNDHESSTTNKDSELTSTIGTTENVETTFSSTQTNADESTTNDSESTASSTEKFDYGSTTDANETTSATDTQTTSFSTTEDAQTSLGTTDVQTTESSTNNPTDEPTDNPTNTPTKNPNDPTDPTEPSTDPNDPDTPTKKPDDDDDHDPENDAFLLKGSKKLKSWIENPDLEHQTSFYFFNVTNAKEVEKNKATPIVEEVGPYVFKEVRKYEIEGWVHDNDYMNLRYKKQYFAVKTSNSRSLDDLITILNVPLVGAYSVGNDLLYLPKKGLHLAIKKFSLFVQQKVGDLLFDGYEDKLVDRISWAAKLLRRKVPTNIKDNKFSLMGMRNNTDNGRWTVDTGKSNLDELGRLHNIDGQSRIGCWGDPCNIIRGTDGIIHPTTACQSEDIEIFEPELNRTVTLERTDKVIKNNGVNMKEYQWSKNTFKSSKDFEDNVCYNPPKDHDYDRYSGILRNSHCNSNIPMVFSLPHFLDSSPFFTNSIKGFKAENSKHASSVVLTEDDGVLVKGDKKIQVNMDTKYASEIRKVPRFVFPLFWLHEQTVNRAYN